MRWTEMVTGYFFMARGRTMQPARNSKSSLSYPHFRGHLKKGDNSPG